MRVPNQLTRSSWVKIAAIYLAAPALVLVCYVITRPYLPHDVPDGWVVVPPTADPTAPLDVVLSRLVVIAMAPFLIAAWEWWHREDGEHGGEEWPTSASSWLLLIWFYCAMGAAALLISVGANDYAAAKERAWWTLLVAVAIIAVVLMPVNHIFWTEVEEHVNEAPPESSIGLAPDERAVWTGSSSSVSRFLVGALLVVASLVAAWFWTPLFLTGLIGLSVLVTSRQFVVIDHRGLSMRRWTRRYVLSLELARIASATVGNHESLVKQIMRLEWGSEEDDDRSTTFGHRSRSGPTIEVRLVNMDVHSVSVGDAKEAVDVLNALVARHRPPQGSGSEVVEATSPSDRSG